MKLVQVKDLILLCLFICALCALAEPPTLIKTKIPTLSFE